MHAEPEIITVDSQISDILRDFEFYDGIYKRASVDEALRLKKEITPHLLNILSKVADSSENLLKLDPPYEAHIYASMLLAHFSERKAHSIFLKICGLPGESLSDLYGELITEELPQFLYRTCAGDISGIKELVLNQEAYLYCRSSAVDALVYAAVKGTAERDSILGFFCQVLEDPEEADDTFLGFLVSAMADLGACEFTEKVKKAYSQGHIDQDIIDFKSFTDIAKENSESNLDLMRDTLKIRMPEDFHQGMEFWACFNAASDFPKDIELSEEENDLLYNYFVRDFETVVRTEPKVGRNDPCTCGSGKKYKKCCAQN